MISHYPNPQSGKNSAGFRFRFKVRAISHQSLYLPIEMKCLPQIQQLIQGVAPTVVFNRNSIQDARLAFDELRKRFDFPFWAANDYLIKDIADPDNIIPLRLNPYQHQIIDTFLKRHSLKQPGNYIITKSFSRCGISTCIQAYILWRQLFQWPKNSNTCSATEINIDPLKANLCRFLNRDVVSSSKSISIPKAFGHHAFFNTCRTPDALRGIDFGFVHLSDMSRWIDPEGERTSRAIAASTSGILPSHHPLVVLEGNIPDDEIMKSFLPNDPSTPNSTLMLPSIRQLAKFTRNPYFLQEVLYSITSQDPFFFHIHIDPINLPR